MIQGHKYGELRIKSICNIMFNMFAKHLEGQLVYLVINNLSVYVECVTLSYMNA